MAKSFKQDFWQQLSRVEKTTFVLGSWITMILLMSIILLIVSTI